MCLSSYNRKEVYTISSFSRNQKYTYLFQALIGVWRASNLTHLIPYGHPRHPRACVAVASKASHGYRKPLMTHGVRRHCCHQIQEPQKNAGKVVHICHYLRIGCFCSTCFWGSQTNLLESCMTHPHQQFLTAPDRKRRKLERHWNCWRPLYFYPQRWTTAAESCTF